jgi:pyruvate/2-oxoglutarate/acetoin dehydrogenase E1 component
MPAEAQPRRITYAQALCEAADHEMARDPDVVMTGLGVTDHRGFYGTAKGLHEKYGPERVFETPLSEDAMTGVVVGAAMAGLRPIHLHERQDFLMLCMNQIVNIAAKAHYMYGGQVTVPITVRSVIGKSWGQGAQHSQALQAFFMHVPGLKVVAPTTPYDAKGCLVQAIRDDNPVMFIEHRMLHYQFGHVPEEGYAMPFGKGRVLAEGSDVTLVGISWMAVECMRARAFLQQVGISAEVIDPVSLAPLDMHLIEQSARKTGKLLVVDSGWTTCGASAEILARLCEGGESPAQAWRMGFAPVTCPTTRCLEDLFYPNGRSIAQFVNHTCLGRDPQWQPRDEDFADDVEFKGPF